MERLFILIYSFIHLFMQSSSSDTATFIFWCWKNKSKQQLLSSRWQQSAFNIKSNMKFCFINNAPFNWIEFNTTQLLFRQKRVSHRKRSWGSRGRGRAPAAPRPEPGYLTGTGVKYLQIRKRRRKYNHVGFMSNITMVNMIWKTKEQFKKQEWNELFQLKFWNE